MKKKKKRKDKRRTKGGKDTPTFWKGTQNELKVKCALSVIRIVRTNRKAHKVIEHNNDDVNDAFITTILLRRNNNNGETTTT